MGVKKFINDTCSHFNLVCSDKERKEKSKIERLERLIKKLKDRKKVIEKELKTIDKKNKNQKEEELLIVDLQIKKGEKILKEKKEKNR